MIRINLLPVRVSKKKEAGKQQLLLFALVLVLGAIGNSSWSGSRASELSSAEDKLKRTKADIAQLDRIIGEVKNIKDQQAALKEKLGVLDRLKAGRSGPVRVLDELATITPRKLWLKKLDEKGGTIQFEGSAASIDDVSAFMSALKGSKYFRAVELKKTSAKTEGKGRIVEFSIVSSVDYAPSAAPAVAAATPR